MADMLTKEQIDALVNAKATDPTMKAVMVATLKRESNYGQNPAAYVPNKAGGVIGIGQIQSKKVGGKYNNFESYADPGQTDVNNPVHTANAALNMIADQWKKSNGNPQQFVNSYFGKAATDKLGGKNSDYVAAISKAVGNPSAFQTTNTGATTTNGLGVASANGQTNAYSQQAIEVANQLANMNRNSLGTFGVNDQNKTQGVVALGNANNTSMNKQAEILGQVQKNWSNFETNADGTTKLDAQGQPVKKGIGTKLFDLTLGSGASALDNMTQKQIQGDVFKSVQQAQTLAKNQQALNQDTVVQPKVFQDAGTMALNQQQADQQAAYQQGTLSNQASQLELQKAELAANLALNTQKLELEKAQLASGGTGAAGTIPTGEGLTSTDNLVAAAKLAGIELPAGVKVADLGKYVPKDKLDVVKAIAANGGALGNDPYTAVQTARQIGTPELLAQATPHIKFQDAITKQFNTSKEAKDLLAKASTGDKGASTQYEVAKRNFITAAYQEAAAGDSKWAGTPGNPYANVNNVYKLAGSTTVPALTGVTLDDFKTLSLTDVMAKGFAAGNTINDFAKVFKAMAEAKTANNNFKAFSAPSSSDKFEVTVAGAENKIDLASPAGVAQYKALASARIASAERATKPIWERLLSSNPVNTAPRLPTGDTFLGIPTYSSDIGGEIKN